MKIVFLNTWNARLSSALSEYILAQSVDTDIFCFQEVGPEMQALATTLLPYHTVALAHKRINEKDTYINAVYARPGVATHGHDTVPTPPGAGVALYIAVAFGETTLHVCNVHGVAYPGHKLDTPERIAQSQAIVGFLAEKIGPKLVGGDFNLLPETESVEAFAGAGYTNLIETYRVPTTRNRMAWAKYPGEEQYYADFVFMSGDAHIERFHIPHNEVSDHLPIEISLGGLNTKPRGVNDDRRGFGV